MLVVALAGMACDGPSGGERGVTEEVGDDAQARDTSGPETDSGPSTDDALSDADALDRDLLRQVSVGLPGLT